MRPSVLVLVLLAVAIPALAAEPDVGEVFSTPSPLARSLEISRRLFTPASYDRLQRVVAAQGIEVKEHDVDLASERFDLIVPPQQPAAGYGVVVFVSPIPDWPLSADWRRELAHRGLVYVAARNSGNSEHVYQRRVPLALHGLAHVQATLPVDPTRIYVAGFSGGSRVALRLAVGYPDVFRGVFLAGGSDELGVDGFVPPPPELMARFQASTRIVFATGAEDRANRGKDGRVRESLDNYCVGGVVLLTPRGLGHDLPDGRDLTRALDSLERPVTESEENADCRAHLLQKIRLELDDAERRLQASDLDGALQRLQAIDATWGGLASPRLEGLVRRLDEETIRARGR